MSKQDRFDNERNAGQDHTGALDVTGEDRGETPDEVRPTGPDRPDRDPFRFLGADPGDTSADADFRREVEALARGLLTADGKSLRASAPDVPVSPPGADGGAVLDPAERPRLGFDIAAGTPFLLWAAGREVRRALAGDIEADRVLLRIAHGRRVTALAVRRSLRLAASTLSTILARFEAEGWVAREPDPRDRRLRRLTLTEAGRSRARALARRWRQVDEDLLGALLPWERDELRRLLTKVASPRSISRRS